MGREHDAGIDGGTGGDDAKSHDAASDDAYVAASDLGVDDAASATAALNAIWGASTSAIYAVGVAGAVVHYDGQSFKSIPSGTKRDLFTVVGRSAGEVFVAGDEVLLKCGPASCSPVSNFGWSTGESGRLLVDTAAKGLWLFTHAASTSTTRLFSLDTGQGSWVDASAGCKPCAESFVARDAAVCLGGDHIAIGSRLDGKPAVYSLSYSTWALHGINYSLAATTKLVAAAGSSTGYYMIGHDANGAPLFYIETLGTKPQSSFGLGSPVDGLHRTGSAGLIAVGDGQDAWHRSTTTWSSKPLPGTFSLRAVWGAGDEAWAPSAGGEILHFDGTLWKRVY